MLILTLMQTLSRIYLTLSDSSEAQRINKFYHILLASSVSLVVVVEIDTTIITMKSVE